MAAETGWGQVFLTGGCLQNTLFADDLATELPRRWLTSHRHRKVPPNDGGIAFGQAAWALARSSGASAEHSARP